MYLLDEGLSSPRCAVRAIELHGTLEFTAVAVLADALDRWGIEELTLKQSAVASTAEEATAENCPGVALFDTLVGNRSLSALTLHAAVSDAEGTMMALQRALTPDVRIFNLRTLVLSHFTMPRAALEILADLLKRGNLPVSSLALRSCDIDELGLVRLCDALRKCQLRSPQRIALRCLDVCENNMPVS